MGKEFNILELKLVNALIADPTFDKLKAYNQNISSFSLNYASEMDHSRLIQWLLNPNESHSLGTMPLKALLNASWNNVSENKIKLTFFEETKLTALQVSQLSLESAISFTEYNANNYGRIDLLIILPDENIAIVIENKYGAAETKDQLKNYRKWGDEKLQSLSVLYLYMDFTERWLGDADEQWVKLSYEWLIETLSTAVNKSHISQRIKYLLGDYYNELEDGLLSYDPYYTVVKELYHDFSRKHRKALKLLNEHKIYNIIKQDYVSNIQNKWSDDLRLKHWYLTNKDVVDLLLDSSENEAIQEFLEENERGLTIEFTDKYLRVHHIKWHDLQDNKDGIWSIFLCFQQASPLDKNELSPRYDLKLFFNFENTSNEKLGIIEKIWSKYSKSKIDNNNLGQRKTVRLASDLSSEKHDIMDTVHKYITEVNALF